MSVLMCCRHMILLTLSKHAKKKGTEIYWLLHIICKSVFINRKQCWFSVLRKWRALLKSPVCTDRRKVESCSFTPSAAAKPVWGFGCRAETDPVSVPSTTRLFDMRDNTFILLSYTKDSSYSTKMIKRWSSSHGRSRSGAQLWSWHVNSLCSAAHSQGRVFKGLQARVYFYFFLSAHRCSLTVKCCKC